MKKTILMLILALTLSVQFTNAQEPTIEQTLEFLNYKNNLYYLTPPYDNTLYEKISYDKDKNQIIISTKEYIYCVIKMDLEYKFVNELWVYHRELQYGEDRDLSVDEMYALLKKSSGNPDYRGGFYLESIANKNISYDFYNLKPKVSLALLHLMKLAIKNRSADTNKYDNLKF